MDAPWGRVYVTEQGLLLNVIQNVEQAPPPAMSSSIPQPWAAVPHDMEKRGLAQAKHSGDMPVGLLKKPLWVSQTDKKRDCTEGGRMGAGLSPFCPISLKWRAKTTGTGNSFTSKPPKLSQWGC